MLSSGFARLGHSEDGRRLLLPPIHPCRQPCTFSNPLGTQVADQCLQKLSCSFTLDVPGLGYLEGGTEPNVCPLDEALHTFKLTIFRRG